MPALIPTLIAFGGQLVGSLVTGSTLAVALKAAAVVGTLTFLAQLTSRFNRDNSQVYQGIVRSAALPARWILGRARVGGMLVYYEEQNEVEDKGPKTVQLAIVLSEGPLEQIEKIWVDGVEVPLRNRSVDNDGVHLNFHGPLLGHIAVWEYFAADGSGGASLRSRSTHWTSQHRLTGKSWVHVELNQNDYSDASDRIWDGFPEIEFLIQGSKIRWPGQPNPTWTENAAAIRYWYMTEICGISPDLIDISSFLAAYATCEQTVSFDLSENYTQAGYQSSSIRYSINGVISNEDTANVENEFDFCWQGYVVEANARYYFRPGVNRPILRVLSDKDILENVSIQVAPILQDRVNSMSMQLTQSNVKNWQGQDLPTQIDRVSKETRDNNEELWLDLGTRQYVQDPIVGGRLVAIALKRAQDLSTFIYRVSPGRHLEWLRVIPGDRIRINHQALGLEIDTVITSVETNEDWSVTITFQSYSQNLYKPVLVLPPEPAPSDDLNNSPDPTDPFPGPDPDEFSP